MAEEKVDIVRRVLAANRSGPAEETADVAVAAATPDIEFTSRITAVEGAQYRGHQGARAYFADMADAFREWRNDAMEVTAVAPDVVLVDNVFHAVGKDSGMAVTLRSAIAFVFSGDKIARCISCDTREEALREATRVG